MVSVFGCAPAPVAPSWRRAVARAAAAWPPDQRPTTSVDLGVVSQIGRSGPHVLTLSNRLTSTQAFGDAVRRGSRAGTGTLVLHLAVSARRDVAARESPPQVGFVVSKAVGSAVARNLVKRRLRHLARERLSSLPGSAVLVVRALPASAAASYESLGADFDSALTRLIERHQAAGRPE